MHPDGGSKAEFFMRFGYSAERWADFAEALREHGRSGEVVRIVETDWDTRYVVEGPLTTPDGRNPGVPVIWIADPGMEGQRLVTAYPSKRFLKETGA